MRAIGIYRQIGQNELPWCVIEAMQPLQRFFWLILSNVFKLRDGAAWILYHPITLVSPAPKPA